jgi:hypothetical protein
VCMFCKEAYNSNNRQPRNLRICRLRGKAMRPDKDGAASSYGRTVPHRNIAVVPENGPSPLR